MTNWLEDLRILHLLQSGDTRGSSRRRGRNRDTGLSPAGQNDQEDLGDDSDVMKEILVMMITKRMKVMLTLKILNTSVLLRHWSHLAPMS